MMVAPLAPGAGRVDGPTAAGRRPDPPDELEAGALLRGSRAVRHPGDAVRIVAGAATTTACTVVARQGRISKLETDLFRVVDDLPSQLELPLRIVMQAGSFLAVGIAGLGALAARRPRLARDFLVAGGGAWFAAKALKVVVDRGRPGAVLPDVIFRGAVDSGLGFPSGHAAVAAALATVAAPSLGRSGRRAAWILVVVVCLARMYVGAHLPIDVVGGVALGWTVGSMVHLAFGAPASVADARDLTQALALVTDERFTVTPAAVDARGSRPFWVDTAAGRHLFVKVVSQVQRDADLIYKVWRALTRRGFEDEAPFATPKQQVEHEAYVSLLAQRAGVHTPRLIAAAAHGDTALVVFERLDAEPLDHAGEVSDALLVKVWKAVLTLRAARIAHRDLRLANILVDRDREPWLIDFGFAEAAASDHRLALDVAELVASSALLVGAERAVAAAHDALGAHGLAAAVPLLQPLALSSTTRSALRRRGGLLANVRTLAADTAGVDQPVLEPLARVRPQTVLMLLGALVALHFLLPQVGDLGRTVDAFRSAEPAWLLVAFVGSAATYPAAGLAQVGAVASPLPYVRTTVVQLAGSFANRITPASVGGAGVNVRYLQRSGLERSDAWAAVALDSAAGVAVHLVALIVIGVLVSRQRVDLVHLPRGAYLLVGLLVTLVVAGIVLWSPLGRRRFVPSLRQSFSSMRAVLRRPVKAAQLFGGSVAVTTLYALTLCASLEAFRTPLPIVQVTAVYLGAAAISSAAPTPSGLGAMEAALVAGLTALGGPPGPVIAGVLAYRLLTFWLPIGPGWYAFRRLLRQGML